MKVDVFFVWGICIAILFGLVFVGPAGAAENQMDKKKLSPLIHVRDSLGNPRKGLNAEIFKDTTLWLDHTAGYMVPKQLYYDEHPEYFAMRLDGTRIPKSTRVSYIHLCMSNPDVVRIATERVLGWVRLERDKRYFCVIQGDGVDWCQCEKCKAMDVMPGNYSDRLLKFVNHIARAVHKEFPDKILLAGAYCGSNVAPLKERPEKNVWVMYSPYWGIALSEVHPLTHPSNAEALAELEAWLKVAPNNMAIYDYNMHYCPSWDAMAEKIKWYSGKGIRSMWFCGFPTCFRDLFKHVVHKEMMRDPNQDPEKLKKGFVYASYGAAAPHVMEYLTLHKERLEKGYPRGMHNGHMPVEFYLDDDFGNKCLRIFDKMIESSGGNAKFRTERNMFVEDWDAAIASKKKKATHKATEPEKIENGIRFPAAAFVEGFGPLKHSWFCEPRMAMFVYTEKAPRPSRMKAEFILNSIPEEGATLRIEGQDADKDLPPQAHIKILINNEKIFEGPCGFVKRGWSWRTFEISKGILKNGKNVMEICNTTKSGRMDHYWFSLSEAQILFE